MAESVAHPAEDVLPDDDWDAFTCHRCLRDYQFCECEDDEQSDGVDPAGTMEP
jgi:hypothetical protein